MPLQTGQILNNCYRIDSLLGHGGMGAVYCAWHLTLNKPVAIKENLDASPPSQARFENEADILLRLTHPHLPQVIDYFFLPLQGQYLVMDFVEGQDLRAQLEQNGALPELRVLAWAAQICDALIYLHSQPSPVTHRDIKPANIRICPDGQVVLVDFGIASMGGEGSVASSAISPGYSPPEQYGGLADVRSDIYALGATLYHLLTGCKPTPSTKRVWGGDTLAPPSQLNPKISARTEQAIMKALEIDANCRFQDVAEFCTALVGPAHALGKSKRVLAAQIAVWVVLGIMALVIVAVAAIVMNNLR